jgi:hypothetical protein
VLLLQIFVQRIQRNSKNDTVESMSTETTAAMNGSVEALENANYIPQNILVTGGAGTSLSII